MAAKFTIIALWSVALAAIVYVVALGVGIAVDLPPVAMEIISQGSVRIALSAALDNAGIHCNKNMIPFDPKPALVTSGIRLGTPAATTRGLKEAEFAQIGRWIAAIARSPFDEALRAGIKADVLEMVKVFPVPA